MLLIGKKITSYTEIRLDDLLSSALKRPVTIDLFLPASYFSSGKTFPFLIINDGQDAPLIRLKSILSRLVKKNEMDEIMVVAIHAGDRMQEYGISSQSDFKKRGSKARLYSQFITEELVPLLVSNFRADPRSQRNAIAGFSLGGLSAFDIGWNHPDLFQRIGVFSGSLWWRSRGYDDGFDETKHRIVHQMVRLSLISEKQLKTQKFWFQTGTHDESADRNENGIIDSIDDTLDLISELVKKGYRPYKDVAYCEVRNGKHNQQTWAKAMPEFLKWAFRKGLKTED